MEISPIRPTPVYNEFDAVPGSVRYLATILTGLAAAGVMTATTHDLLLGAAGLALAVPALVGDVLRQIRQWRAVAAAQEQVTPVASPAVVVDGQLVPLSVGRHASLDDEAP